MGVKPSQTRKHSIRKRPTTIRYWAEGKMGKNGGKGIYLIKKILVTLKSVY